MPELYVLLNHLFLSLDSGTYQSISESDFLRTEFAVSETRTTIRNDYPDGYTGVYFYGDETYFEFFDSGNSVFPLGSFGIATGFEVKGQLESVKQDLDALGGGIAHPVDRMVEGEAIPWFTGLFSKTETGYGGPSVWGMEYSAGFIQEWLGYASGLDGSILQRDLLHSYAIKLGQTELREKALMKDVTFIDAVLKPEFLAAFSEQFTTMGCELEKDGVCDLVDSRNARVRLCPASEGRGVGIYELGFSLHRNHDGAAKMQFGSSSLTFEGKQAKWVFTFPEAKPD